MKNTFESFEVFTAVYLKMPFLWGKTLRYITVEQNLQDRQCTYHVTVWRVSANIIAMDKSTTYLF